MKGLKLAVAALLVTSLAQAGIIDTAKGYIAQGQAAYNQYSPQAKEYAGQFATDENKARINALRGKPADYQGKTGSVIDAAGNWGRGGAAAKAGL